jgi:dihydropteroate synthase
MNHNQASKTPSHTLAEQAVAALLAAQLIREKDLEEMRSALGIGTATAEQWIWWLDLAVVEQEDGRNE